MDKEKVKVLVIEDEPDIREGLAFLLSDHYEVVTAESGDEGLKKAAEVIPDLILLDLNMPDLNGYQVCESLRTKQGFERIPIIVLTAYNETQDRTRAFELGADDYIPKPFDNTELLARIQRKIAGAKVDTTYEISASGTIKCGSIQLDSPNKTVQVDDQIVQLSALEFKLFHLLVANLDKIVSQKKMIEIVWENQDVSERIIAPHILSLRNKIKGLNYQISSVYGCGYILKSSLSIRQLAN